MGKTSRWLRNFLTGKKDKEKSTTNSGISTQVNEVPATPISSILPPTTPKEKKRWSFRRSSATNNKDLNSAETAGERTPLSISLLDYSEDDKKNNETTIPTAAMPAVVKLIATTTTVEDAAATKIQSVFRSYLARKALHALKGLVKLQALVRGHLVRKQATATLRCMQALVAVQAKVRAQRIRMAEESKPPASQKQTIPRKSMQENRYDEEFDRDFTEENIKIVEMDLGSTKSRYSSYSNHTEARLSSYYGSTNRGNLKHDNNNHQISPAPSALTDMSPRAYSGHFEDYSYYTAQSSPRCHSAISKPDYAESMSYENPFFPNYMSNTESSRAKARSHSAPKQRPESSYERQQPTKRRPSMEGRNIPRAIRMQRSSSHVGATAQNYQYPSHLKLDKSTVSVVDSECGSTSTILTNNNYCKSLVAYEAPGFRY